MIASLTRSTSLGRAAALATLGLLAMLSCGCARQGILRLDVELREGPGDFGDRSHLVVEVAGDAEPSSWASQSFATQGAQFVTLSASATPSVPFDVIASRTDVAVSVRVRYCRRSDCAHPDDIAGLGGSEPGFRFTIPRAIWIGHVTRVRLAVPPIEREGADYEAIPSSSDTTRPYPASGWLCRCQVRCESDGEDTNELGSCEGTRAPCDPEAPHPCD